MGNLPETVLQFGAGRFLRGFADLFLHELNQGDAAPGRAVVLQSTGTQRAELLNRQGCRYHVAVRGLRDGQAVDQTVDVQSISRALTASTDWPHVLEAARAVSLTSIISNTTEAGYALEPGDSSSDRTHAPRSFPAKLLVLLVARFDAGLPAVTILPCELLDQNADRLRALVTEQARQWQIPVPVLDWIRGACSWRNALVDRIVSAPRPDDPLAAADPLLAVAEPFALWLMDGPPGASGLERHPAVRVVDRLEPYYLRKVRILNGAHTALVAKARPLGLETVRQAVLDLRIGPWLESLLFEEIVPTLSGRTDGPEQFARQTLERFANPYLEHRLADIAIHHEVKCQTRLLPTYHEYCDRFGRSPRLLGEALKGMV